MDRFRGKYSPVKVSEPDTRNVLTRSATSSEKTKPMNDTKLRPA